MNEDRLKHFKNTLDVMVNDESEMHRNRLKDAAFHFYKQAIERVQELEKDIKDYESSIVENGIDIFNMTNEMKALEIRNKRYREAIENIEKGYKRILSEQSTRLLTEQYTRVANLKFIQDEIEALEGEEWEELG